jgi:hypothetical protein
LFFKKKGGPDYTYKEHFDIQKDIPMNGIELFKFAKKITNNIIYLLPKNIDKKQVKHQILSLYHEECEFEENYINHQFKYVTLYFGDLIQK